MSQKRLQQEIISLSVAQNWGEAKTEWSFESAYDDPEHQTCLCGHHPIREICEIVNVENGATATVGNCCVTKFGHMDSDAVFRNVKRLRSRESLFLREAAIRYVESKGWFNEKQRGLLWSMSNKRKFSSLAQRDFYNKVSRRFLILWKRDSKIHSAEKWVDAFLEG